jgi:hypothetical protein
MFIPVTLSLVYLASIIAIGVSSDRAIKRRSVAELLLRLKHDLGDRTFRWSLLKFGEFIRVGTYKPMHEQFDVARLVLICLKSDVPCFNIRFETLSMRGHYRCLISQHVPGYRWRTIGCRGRIGDAVWDAFVPMVDASTDVGLRHARPKLTLIR